MPKSRKEKLEDLKEKHLREFREELAFEHLRERNPAQWVSFQRVHKLVDIQEELEDGAFPDGACFLHATTVGNQHFRVRKITGIDLDTFQVTVEIYSDEELEAGIVVLPLEQIEWFGFPSRAVPIHHFEGFIGIAPMPGQGGLSARTPRAEAGTPPATGELPVAEDSP
ncbi:MAG: hypothetical protein AAB263_10975 [Planctomycetota bacterium]